MAPGTLSAASVNSAFQLRGLTVALDGVRYLVKVLKGEQDPEAALSAFFNALSKASLTSQFITQDLVVSTVASLSSTITSSSSSSNGTTGTSGGLSVNNSNNNNNGRVPSTPSGTQQSLPATPMGQVPSLTSNGTARTSPLNAPPSTSQLLSIITTPSMPSWRFDEARKCWVPGAHGHGSISRPHAGVLGFGSDVTWMWANRYSTVKSRLLRNPIFAPKSIALTSSAPGRGSAAPGGADHYPLTPVDALIGSRGRRCVFGLLVENTDGGWSLEDPKGTVPLDLDNASTTSGVFTANCLVLAEGLFVDGTFVVSALVMPPAETAQESKDALGSGVDLFGAAPAQRDLPALAYAESQTRANGRHVFVSDVHLDDPTVQRRLAVLLEGLAAAPPHVVVMMGPFTSSPFGSSPGAMAASVAAWETLGKSIANFPELLEETTWIFIPGPGDPGPGMALPMPPLPGPIRRAMHASLPGAVFGSNPLRMRWGTQEFVLMRDDTVHRLQRAAVLPVSTAETDDITLHVVRTLADQSTLSPLPLTKRIVYPGQDDALRLFPLPTLLVTGDRYNGYSTGYQGMGAVNPGSFAVEGSFVLYDPVHRSPLFSRIPA